MRVYWYKSILSFICLYVLKDSYADDTKPTVWYPPAATCTHVCPPDTSTGVEAAAAVALFPSSPWLPRPATEAGERIGVTS